MQNHVCHVKILLDDIESRRIVMMHDYGRVNVINYLAIISLEKIGNFAPSEKEITCMEKFLSSSIKASINQYKRIRQCVDGQKNSYEELNA